MRPLIIALCFFACSSIAFIGGMRFMRMIFVVNMYRFFDSYYARISAEQSDALTQKYCDGAVDMFHGILAEFGFKIVERADK